MSAAASEKSFERKRLQFKRLRLEQKEFPKSRLLPNKLWYNRSIEQNTTQHQQGE